MYMVLVAMILSIAVAVPLILLHIFYLELTTV